MLKEQVTAESKTIEQHAAALKLPQWQFDGLKAAHKWAQGKMLSEGEFKQALSDWLKMPMSGKEQGKDKK